MKQTVNVTMHVTLPLVMDITTNAKSSDLERGAYVERLTETFANELKSGSFMATVGNLVSVTVSE